jgi:hypothetical protein
MADDFLLPLQALGNAVVLGGVALVAFVTWREGSRALTFAANLLNSWCVIIHLPIVCAALREVVFMPAMPFGAVLVQCSV